MRLTRVILAIHVFFLSGIAPAMAQSVADVARKSREESKKKKAAIVITDDMLKPAAKTAPDVIDAGRNTPGDSLTLQERTYYNQIYRLHGQLLLLAEEYKKAERQHRPSMMRYIQGEIKKTQDAMDVLEEKARKQAIKPGVIRDAKNDVREKLLEDGRITR